MEPFSAPLRSCPEAPGRPVPGWRRGAVPVLMGAGITGLAALAAGRFLWTGYGPVAALLVYAGIAVLVLILLPARPTGEGFGAANAVTLLRGAIAAWLAGLIGSAVPFEAAGWWLAGATVLALALDGIDGRIARSRRTADAFGARFDMEVDAFLLLVLSILAVETGRAGPWVLGIGLMRYLFIAASAVLPALRRPLPESFRRKLVCVLQGMGLAFCLMPPVDPDVGSMAATAALILLAWSFAIDCRRLLARPVGRAARSPAS